MDTSIGLPNMLQKILLSCGILASLLRVGTDIYAGKMWKGYSFVSQSISELIAAGSPTRSLALSLEFLFDMLIIALAIGVWQLSGESLLIRITAGLIAANAIINFLVSLFLPMRINPDGTSSASTIHVVIMATGVFCYLLAMVLAGVAYTSWFRYYSFGTLLVYLVLTIVRLLVPSPTSGGLPVATVGAQERTMVLGYLLWIVALAIQNFSKLAG